MSRLDDVHERIRMQQIHMVHRPELEIQYDQHIRLVYEELLWKSGDNKMAVVLVDLEREATNTQPCKHTLPSWWQTVDICRK